jgi:hypothetical protein
MVNRLLGLAVASLALAVATRAGLAAPQDIAQTPVGQEVARGSEAADSCSGKEFPAVPAHYDACIDAALDKGRKQSNNPTAFDAGFFLSAWVSRDMIVHPLEKLGPAFSTPSADAPAWKPLAIKYIRAYDEARKKIGLTDAQSLHILLLDHDIFIPRIELAERGY